MICDTMTSSTTGTFDPHSFLVDRQIVTSVVRTNAWCVAFAFERQGDITDYGIRHLNKLPRNVDSTEPELCSPRVSPASPLVELFSDCGGFVCVIA